jgi:hypothetical protein
MKSAAARRRPNIPTASGIAAADPSTLRTRRCGVRRGKANKSRSIGRQPLHAGRSSLLSSPSDPPSLGAGEGQQHAPRPRHIVGLVEEPRHDAITSPSFATKGLTLAGTMSEIPREAVRQLAIDLEQGTLATADGTVIWRAVVVQRVAAPRAPWPSRSAGATRSKRETAKAWLVARFPAGIGNTKNETLLADMQADGERTGDDTLRLMTDSTMRRALRELKGGQNPVK